MEYNGKLFGRVGKVYWPLEKTTYDFEKLEHKNQQMIALLERIKINIKFSGKGGFEKPLTQTEIDSMCTEIEQLIEKVKE